MAEDRGLEPYEQLLTLCEQARHLRRLHDELCRKADDKYNSGLFHFQKEAGVSEAPDQITPRLAVDDKVFKPILQSLYFAHGSPYHFGVLPVEILGTVYERFLGKVIRLTAGPPGQGRGKARSPQGRRRLLHARLHRRLHRQADRRPADRGQKPRATGRQGQGKQPLRVLDMACGSGSFLLGAYQCLLDHCLKWYIDNKPEDSQEGRLQGPPQRRNGG